MGLPLSITEGKCNLSYWYPTVYFYCLLHSFIVFPPVVMVPFQVKLHLVVPGQVSSVWSGGAGLVRLALPLRPHLQSAHRLHPSPPPPLAGRLPYRFRVRPVSRVPGGGRWEFVSIAVAEELAEVANRAEIHPHSSGPQQNLHHPWVTTHYCTGQDTLSPCNSQEGFFTHETAQVLTGYLFAGLCRDISLLLYWLRFHIWFSMSSDFFEDIEFQLLVLIEDTYCRNLSVF